MSIVPVLLLIALSAWALASPIGSSADDDFHLPSAWCGLGERAGLCERTIDEEIRIVPELVAHGWECHARNSEMSAACLSHLDSDAMPTTTRTNDARGLYPPVYYATMGMFASQNIVASVLAQRLVSVVIFLALTCALWVLLPPGRRITFGVAWLITSVPLAMFLIPSNNPSSWAIISSGSLWIGLVGYFESTGRRRTLLGAVVAVAALVGAGARADAALFAAASAVLAIFLSWRPSRHSVLSLVLPSVIIAAATVFYLASAQGGDAASAGLGAAPGTGAGDAWGELLFTNLLDVPSAVRREPVRPAPGA